MTLRAALYLFLACLLAGCVRTGDVDPMSTSEGRAAARDAYIQLGLGHLRQGSTERAKEPLRKALELDSSSAEAYATLAVVYQREMEPKLAEENYRKAVSLSDGDARILNNYGGFLFEQKRYQDAYEQYLKASMDTLYTERSRVFENLGLTALRLGNPEEAKQHFQKALRMNSLRSTSLLELGLLSYASKDYVAARSYYEGFVQLARQNPQSLLLGIRLAKIFDDRSQAASLGLQMKRLYPGTPEYQQYLSEQ